MSQAKPKANTLFQVSISCAMEVGVFDGACDFHTIMQKGNTGLGTFEHFDGEMVAIEGNYYQIKSDGTVNLAWPEQRTPFVQVVNFEPQETFHLADISGFEALTKTIEAQLENKNVPYVISIESAFQSIKFRSVCAQSQPYPTLDFVLKNQVVFNLEHIKGTMVGFWFPNYWTTTAAPGLHLHFMTADRQAGGHVLDLDLKAGEMTFSPIYNIHTVLPETALFAKAALKPSEITMEQLQQIALKG